ncbi:hypothetical protein ARMSODRAFT_702735 [Armillaria solidipes]|uniref:Uncharacterized protein n=1 Tax=Armillaria solidipes TaxID=1076256 RepID=A0A2H3CC21_9AGAR|nr:hypothetical protein ARMSODRAFT_702735 [Armillaria solidipes]
MARAMLRLGRRPNEGPYLVATDVPPQLFDEWSTYDSAYHMFYDHDYQSVFSFHDPSPQHAAAIEQFTGAFEQGYTNLYHSKSNTEFQIRDYLHMAGSSASSLRDGSVKEPDAIIQIIHDVQELVPCLVFECAYMNEDEATLVSETLRWAECGQFSVGLKIQNIVGWPTSPRLTFYTADRCGTVATRYTIPHDAVDPRDVTRRRPAASLESMERVFKPNMPLGSPGDYFQAKLDKVTQAEGRVGRLEKCYKMLGLSPKLSKHVSIFEQLRAQQEEEECQEYYFEESGDEGDAGGSDYGEVGLGTGASSDDGGMSPPSDWHEADAAIPDRSDEFVPPSRPQRDRKPLYVPHIVTTKKRPPLLEPEEVRDGVLVDGCSITISLSALYGDNPLPSPLSPDDQLLLDVFTIRKHISYAVSRLVRYTEKLRESVEAVEGTV